MDGVMGGIIGGAVTALAVILTLRHERTLSASNRMRSAVYALGVVASRAAGKASRRPTIDSEDLRQDMTDITTHAAAISVESLPQWGLFPNFVDHRVGQALEAFTVFTGGRTGEGRQAAGASSRSHRAGAGRHHVVDRSMAHTAEDVQARSLASCCPTRSRS